MRKILSALTLAAIALAAFPSLAVGPNCTTAVITAFNQNPTSGVATAGSTVQMAISGGAPSANLYSSANPDVTSVSVEITNSLGASLPFVGTLVFQTSQDEGQTFLGIPSLGPPYATSTTKPGNFGFATANANLVRVTAIATTAIPAFLNAATVRFIKLPEQTCRAWYAAASCAHH